MQGSHTSLSLSLSVFAITEKSYQQTTMSSLTSLKRSSPSMHHHFSLIQQRLQTRQFSSLPLINASNIDSNSQHDSIAGSFLKWISGIAVGSSLGLAYWYSTSASDLSSAFFNKPFFSFADWSTETLNLMMVQETRFIY
ncbi:hypothetical protein REPUB_Repub18cG0156800 [Reevesia pubescens]